MTMRQLTLFDAPPASGHTPGETPSGWESAVPASPISSSNRHWSLVSKPGDLATTMLAILSVQWEDPATGEWTIFVPYTGSTIRGRDFLKDVWNPFHGEIAAIAKLYGIGEHRVGATNACRGETRAVVVGPFPGQDGLRRQP